MSTFGTEYCYFLALVLIRNPHVVDFEIELVFEVFDAKKRCGLAREYKLVLQMGAQCTLSRIVCGNAQACFWVDIAKIRARQLHGS